MQTFLLPLLLAGWAAAQGSLAEQIRAIAATAQGKVSVACSLPGTTLNCDLNPHGHPPMQSVFKLPLAIAVLQRVDQGKLSLDQPVRFQASDRFVPRAYSPLQDRYPEAEVDVPLRELLRLAVALSDNAAADLLLRLIGGPRTVDGVMRAIGIGGFHLRDNEHLLHREVNAQYRNWFEPAGAVQLLRRIADRSPLSPASTALLLEWMAGNPTAPRLAALLPAGTDVRHKPGTSSVDHGLAHATNDIGLITLPDGRRLAIAVFVTDSTADEQTRNGVIGRIALAAYQAAMVTR